MGATQLPDSGDNLQSLITEEQYLGQVIRRSAAILRALEDQPGGRSVADIAGAVDLPRSSVHRVLKALEEEHLVSSSSEAGGFRLGPALMSLASSANSWLVEAVHPFLVDLSRSLDETVDLAVLSRCDVYFVDQVLSGHRLQAVSQPGLAFPAFTTANGKALLAELDDERVVALAEECPMSAPAGTDALLAQLRDVRSTRVAFDRQEHQQGISAVGTALPNPYGIAVALSVPAPTGRFVGREAEIVKKLLAARDEIADHFQRTTTGP